MHYVKTTKNFNFKNNRDVEPKQAQKQLKNIRNEQVLLATAKLREVRSYFS